MNSFMEEMYIFSIFCLRVLIALNNLHCNIFRVTDSASLDMIYQTPEVRYWRLEVVH